MLHTIPYIYIHIQSQTYKVTNTQRKMELFDGNKTEALSRGNPTRTLHVDGARNNYSHKYDKYYNYKYDKYYNYKYDKYYNYKYNNWFNCNYEHNNWFNY